MFLFWIWYSFPLWKKAAAGQFQSLISRLESTDKVLERTEVYVSNHGKDTILSHYFQQFLKVHGIFWQTAPCSTPNYNLIVERNIQTKKAIQQALHIQSGLTVGYWPVSSVPACMILNRLLRASNPNGWHTL